MITSPFTFIATAEAISYVGAIPIFLDIEEDTFNLDPDQVEDLLKGRWKSPGWGWATLPKALLPVHLYGRSANMGALRQIAASFELKLIEDCAQAIGSEHGGQRAGSWGRSSIGSRGERVGNTRD